VDEPNIAGESHRALISAKSKSRNCFMAETSVDIRKAGVDDVGRVSGGKYHFRAQFQP
jgi:hypothetical protein